MSEIFESVRIKEKLRILLPMVALAVILASLIGVLSYCTADRHTHVYDFELEFVDGRFNLSGVCTVENCEDPFLRQENISGVKVLSSVSSTCHSEGERVYSYTTGGKTVTYTEVIPVIPHRYSLEFVEGGSSVQIIGECIAEGCTDTRLNINEVTDVQLISREQGDCFTPDKLTYSYVINGQTKTFTTLSTTTAPHTIGGQTTDKLVNADGSFNFGTEGVIINAGQPFICNTKASAYYVCEHCKQAVPAEVLYPDHAFVYNEADTTAPTCDADGCAILRCQNGVCEESIEILIPKIVIGENTFTISTATELYREVVGYVFVNDEYGFTVAVDFEIGELLSHAYVYELQIDPSNNRTINLIGRCDQPDCQTPNYFEADVPAICVDTSTCQQKGVVTWSYEKDGELVVLSAVSTIFAHHDYQYDGNSATAPTIKRSGFVEIACQTEGCTEAHLIDLPKIILEGDDKNTEITGETEIGRIGEYTYFDEENLCIIKLTVVIYNTSEQ